MPILPPSHTIGWGIILLPASQMGETHAWTGHVFRANLPGGNYAAGITDKSEIAPQNCWGKDSAASITRLSLGEIQPQGSGTDILWGANFGLQLSRMVPQFAFRFPRAAICLQLSRLPLPPHQPISLPKPFFQPGGRARRAGNNESLELALPAIPSCEQFPSILRLNAYPRVNAHWPFPLLCESELLASATLQQGRQLL